MALTGLHITFGYAGTNPTPIQTSSVFRVSSSETIAAAGTSTTSAPAFNRYSGEPIARVTASAAAFVAFGTSPNATSGARIYLNALETKDFVVRPGDKIAWIAA